MNTAVLLFNHSEKQKASLRKFAPRITDRRLSQLIEQLNTRTKEVSQKAGLPFFQVNASGQENFGEQLYEAYQELFAQGYEAVIGISNDCPSFHTTDLTLSIQAFNQSDLVLGPAKDGGLYLLGIKKDTITASEFLQLGWQSGSLCDGFQYLAQSKGWAVTQLEVKADMDTVQEFKLAFSSNFEYLIRFQNLLFSFCTEFVQSVEQQTLQLVCLSFSRRGPPVV